MNLLHFNKVPALNLFWFYIASIMLSALFKGKRENYVRNGQNLTEITFKVPCTWSLGEDVALLEVIFLP